MNITALRYNFYEKNGGDYSDHNLVAANAIFCVITDFLLRTAPSLVLTLSCRRDFSCVFFHDMQDYLFQNWDKIDKSIQIVVVDNNSVHRVGGQRNRNLIIVDSYEAFLDANIISYTREHNFNEYNYIFLKISDDLMKSHLQQILEYCWSHYIIHCSVQVQNERGEVFVYTYFPYTANYCGDVVPVIINQFDGAKFVEPDLFPRKLDNLHQCPLRAALWQIPSFMRFTTENENTTTISGGVEGKFILELASLLNFTIEVRIPPRNEQRGIIMGNTTTGALRMLNDGIAEFSLGGFALTVERNEVVSSTISYYQNKFVLFALRSAYDLTSWEILIFPFHTYTWLLILFTLLLAVLKAFIANRLYQRCASSLQKYDRESSYLNIFSTFIGIPVSNTPLATKARILFVLWLCFALVIRTVYQGLLFHLIRTRVENKLPETFHDLKDLNFTAVTNTLVVKILRNISILEGMHKVILNTSNGELNFQYIEEKQSKWFLAINALDFIIVYVNKYKKPGIYKILPQELVGFRSVIYMPKHSFLIDQFNEEIIWFIAAGFFEKWRRSELDMEYYKANPFVEDRVHGWKELQMIFFIYLFGTLMACLVFILEFMSSKYKILRRMF